MAFLPSDVKGEQYQCQANVAEVIVETGVDQGHDCSHSRPGAD
jgi:hypothetical protein